MLFNNIREVRRYITISAANNDTSVPIQRRAEEEFLIPVLGQDLFTAMEGEALAAPLPAATSTLLDKCRYALAYLLYFKELPFIHTRITDAGLKNTNTDNQTTAFRYQFENLLNSCEAEGRAGLEKIFTYLMADKASATPLYPDWASSDAYTRLNKNLIKTGTDFSAYFHLHQPHRTFYALQPIMQEVEDLYIKPAIGPAFFTELKETAAPSDDEQEVLDLLCKALANLTIHKACTKLSVKVRTEGFTVLLAPGTDKELNGETSAGDRQLELLRRDTDRDGNNYLNVARKILNERATASIFATYFGSSLYKSPTATTTDVNDTMNGIYCM